MPRKIPDLENKILHAAASSFLEKGYATVSMKVVAAEAGTSVGNLYNYYPSKKDLFLAGRRRFLEEFQGKLEALSGRDLDPRQELENLLLELLDTLEKWSGLYEEFWAAATRELTPADVLDLRSCLREDLMRRIIEPIDALIRKIERKRPGVEKLVQAPDLRLAMSLVSLLKMLVLRYPGQGEANRGFVRQILSLLYETGGAASAARP